MAIMQRKLKLLLVIMGISVLSLVLAAAPARAVSAACGAFVAELGYNPGESSNVLFPLLAGESLGYQVTASNNAVWEIRIEDVSGNVLASSGRRVGSSNFNFTVTRDGTIREIINNYSVLAGQRITIIASCGTGRATTAGSATNTLWEGNPNSSSYDGRINGAMGEVYAVYCRAGELQVWFWNSSIRRGTKVGAASYATINAMANPESREIGSNVFLGRSNNVLTVVIPGVFTKDNIDLARCVGGGYEPRR